MSRPVLWVSTSTATRGGVASYVRTMRATPLWSTWSVRHVATHADGPAALKVLRFVGGALRVLARLALRPPRLLHLHTASYGSFARKSMLARAAVCRGVPVVLHVHGAAFADFHDGSSAPVRRWIRTTLESVDAVVALGPTWATRLQRIAPGARVVVVPNAVDVGPPPRRRDPEATVRALFLGQVSDDKGVPVLLEAWARARATPAVADAHLVVAGVGAASEQAAERAGRPDLAGSVELPGWVSPDAARRLVEASDLLVLPSRWEGQPMAVLEAMAGGLAVLSTPVGGVPDLVDETVGVLVPPDDVEALAEALSCLLGDRGLLARLGAGARARAERDFDTATTWRALDALYRELAR